MKFQVGDLVTGIDSGWYSITNHRMLVGRVTRMMHDGYMRVEVVKHVEPVHVGLDYTVHAKHFKPFNPLQIMPF